MIIDYDFAVSHWSNRLQEELDNIEEIRQKVHSYWFNPLETDELYQLRAFMMELKAISDLLAEDVALHKAGKKKSLFRRIFRK